MCLAHPTVAQSNDVDLLEILLSHRRHVQEGLWWKILSAWHGAVAVCIVLCCIRHFQEPQHVPLQQGVEVSAMVKCFRQCWTQLLLEQLSLVKQALENFIELTHFIAKCFIQLSQLFLGSSQSCLGMLSCRARIGPFRLVSASPICSSCRMTRLLVLQPVTIWACPSASVDATAYKYFSHQVLQALIRLQVFAVERFPADWTSTPTQELCLNAAPAERVLTRSTPTEDWSAEQAPAQQAAQ
mmetsp:Transcript_53421/g.98793  ORF Transcript_53421/g.98793 Transcript_53421/m.98793 type:complete len:241 (+) Transcript_53421:1836-2558(+)